jgi:hypothetical protein
MKYNLLIYLSLLFVPLKGQDIRSLLLSQQQLQNWHILDSARVFKDDELFDLIDGGAELHLEYGFKQVVTCLYENKSQATLHIEIYQMTSDSAAYGLYSMMQPGNGKLLEIGQEARMTDYYLLFWKGIYFVTVTVSDKTEELKNALRQVASQIAEKISTRGNKPSWISILPKDGLLEQKYFKGNIGLSNIYPFGTENIFGVKEGCYGKYKGLQLFVFKYNSAGEAKTRFQSSCDVLAKNGVFTTVKVNQTGFECTDNDNRKISGKLKDNYIEVSVFGNEKKLE